MLQFNVIGGKMSQFNFTEGKMLQKGVILLQSTVHLKGAILLQSNVTGGKMLPGFFLYCYRLMLQGVKCYSLILQEDVTV